MTQKAELKDKKGYLGWILEVLDSSLFAYLRAKLHITCVWHESCNSTLSLAFGTKERLNHV